MTLPPPSPTNNNNKTAVAASSQYDCWESYPLHGRAFGMVSSVEWWATKTKNTNKTTTTNKQATHKKKTIKMHNKEEQQREHQPSEQVIRVPRTLCVALLREPCSHNLPKGPARTGYRKCRPFACCLCGGFDRQPYDNSDKFNKNNNNNITWGLYFVPRGLPKNRWRFDTVALEPLWRWVSL